MTSAAAVPAARPPAKSPGVPAPARGGRRRSRLGRKPSAPAGSEYRTPPGRTPRAGHPEEQGALAPGPAWLQGGHRLAPGAVVLPAAPGPALPRPAPGSPRPDPAVRAWPGPPSVGRSPPSAGRAPSLGGGCARLQAGTVTPGTDGAEFLQGRRAQEPNACPQPVPTGSSGCSRWLRRQGCGGRRAAGGRAGGGGGSFALLKQESSRCQRRTHLRPHRPGSAHRPCRSRRPGARLGSFPGQVGKAESLARGEEDGAAALRGLRGDSGGASGPGVGPGAERRESQAPQHHHHRAAGAGSR